MKTSENLRQCPAEGFFVSDVHLRIARRRALADSPGSTEKRRKATSNAPIAGTGRSRGAWRLRRPGGIFQQDTGSILMRVFRIAAALALLAGAAHAQAPNVNLIPELQSKTPEEKEAEAAR